MDTTKFDSSTILVATVKNDGATILEWVAYHLLIGFDKIIIYQNDSTDLTEIILKELHNIGAITYFDNPAKIGRWQSKAYRRASKLKEFSDSDWVLALDTDEYLYIKTEERTVQSLTSLFQKFDAVLINWKRFGSSNKRDDFF